MPRYRRDPSKKPPNIVVWDNGGKTADRYTIVSRDGHVGHRGRTYFPHAMSSSDPYHPQGVGMTGETEGAPLRRGKDDTVADWDDLPLPVRKFALEIANWGVAPDSAHKQTTLPIASRFLPRDEG